MACTVLIDVKVPSGRCITTPNVNTSGIRLYCGVALDIAKIPDPRTREQMAEAVRVPLKKYFN